jgi:hypothetical protein
MLYCLAIWAKEQHIDGQVYMHSALKTKQAMRGSASILKSDNAKICDEAKIIDF